MWKCPNCTADNWDSATKCYKCDPEEQARIKAATKRWNAECEAARKAHAKECAAEQRARNEQLAQLEAAAARRRVEARYKKLTTSPKDELQKRQTVSGGGIETNSKTPEEIQKIYDLKVRELTEQLTDSLSSISCLAKKSLSTS